MRLCYTFSRFERRGGDTPPLSVTEMSRQTLLTLSGDKNVFIIKV